jgi:hypothetical protein
MYTPLMHARIYSFIIFSEWIVDPSSERAHQLLRTQYHAVTQNLGNPLATKW